MSVRFPFLISLFVENYANLNTPATVYDHRHIYKHVGEMIENKNIGNGADFEELNLSKALAVAAVEEQCFLAEAQAVIISSAKQATETGAEFAYDL